MKIALIGNGTFVDCSAELKQSDVVIAVDGGANHCRQMGVTPNFIIGDGDSLTQETTDFFSDVEYQKSEDQHFSDLQKAVEFVQERFSKKDITSIDLYCFTSMERFDHSLATFFVIREYAQLPITLHGDGWWAQYVTKQREYNDLQAKTVSLIPIGECNGIQTTGLQWEVTDKILQDRSISLSNTVVSNPCVIQVEEGGVVFIVNQQEAL